MNWEHSQKRVENLAWGKINKKQKGKNKWILEKNHNNCLTFVYLVTIVTIIYICVFSWKSYHTYYSQLPHEVGSY